MQITVIGRHTYRVPPETGLVSLSLDAEAVSAREATSAASEGARDVAEALAALAADGGPVAFHAVGPMTTSSWRPHGPDGPLPPRHAASVRVRARFTDVTALAAFVAAWALRDGCQLHGVEWELTDETRGRLESEALTTAVLDAHRRAEVIALAAGADATVTPVSFRDPQVARHPEPYGGEAMFARAVGLSADTSSPLVADDIVGQVSIEATYSAR